MTYEERLAGMIRGKKVVLRTKNLSDARNDYDWQRDPELAYLDAAPPISLSFEDYRAEYAAELQYPSLTRRSFAVDTLEGKHIGNAVYYNIDDVRRSTELGIMMGDRDYWNKGYGTDAVCALIDHIFRRTRMDRIYLKTLVTNKRAQRSFRKCHLEPCGHLDRDGHHFILMDITRERWRKLPAQADSGERR